jgi:2-succinyl-6-hydroxy-2,4-cyclohexadiene-1-carboxylate synthase
LKSNYYSSGQLHLHFLTAGKPSNPAVLFMHGFLGSAMDWGNITDHLSKEFYCISLDLPGHGNTVIKGDAQMYSMEGISGEIYRFIKKNKLQHPSLLGYSMGGRLALYLAVSYPQIWTKIILVSSSPGLRTVRERSDRVLHDERLALKLEGELLEDFLSFWYDQPLFKTLVEHKDYKSLYLRRLKNNPSTLAQSLRLMSTGKQRPLWRDISAIDHHVLLLAGEQDKKYCKIMTEMDKLSPKARLQVIKKSGHNMPFEQPLVFYEQVHKFLTST